MTTFHGSHLDQSLPDAINPVGCFDLNATNFKTGELNVLSYRIIKAIFFVISITPILNLIR